MKISKSIFIIVVLPLLLLTGFGYHSIKKNCSDLVVSEISRPEYEGQIKGSIVNVTIKNKGDKPSVETTAKLYDLDIGVSEAIEMGLSKEHIALIEENVARAKDYKEESPDDEDINEFDYDKYVENIQAIPVINPGESVTITFRIEGHWIYDSNCEIEVFVDDENKVKECDESNNKKQFFEWG